MNDLPPGQSSRKKFFDVYPTNRAVPPATSRPIINNERQQADPMVREEALQQEPEKTEPEAVEVPATPAVEPSSEAAVQPVAVQVEASSSEPAAPVPDEDYIPKVEHQEPYVTAHIQPTATNTAPKRSRFTQPKIVIALVLGVVLALCGVFYFGHL